MNGHKIWMKFISTFVRVFTYLFIFIVVGMGSYRLTMAYYKETKQNTTSYVQQSNEVISEAKLDQVATNAIFAVNKETAEVEHIVLEIFNCNTKNLDFITIPVSIQYTMDQELYAKMGEASSDIPQIIKLSDITLYFDQAVAYEYGVLLLEEILDSDISFYTAMITEDFAEYFEEKKEQGKKSGICQVREDVLDAIEGLSTEEEFLDVLSTHYTKIQSNLTLQKRQNYIKYYLNANYDYVHYHLLAGVDEAGGTGVVTKEASEQLAQIVGNAEVYRQEQDEKSSDTATQSVQQKTNSIQILNASMVQGLAASYQNRLEADGYKVDSIGNYTGTTSEVTRIVVREEGIGEELLSYFNGATMEVGTIEGESDIVIILGTKDA